MPRTDVREVEPDRRRHLLTAGRNFVDRAEVEPERDARARRDVLAVQASDVDAARQVRHHHPAAGAQLEVVGHLLAVAEARRQLVGAEVAQLGAVLVGPDLLAEVEVGQVPAEGAGVAQPVLAREVLVGQVGAERREPGRVRERDLRALLPRQPGGVPERRVGVVGERDARHAHAGRPAVGLDLEEGNGRRDDGRVRVLLRRGGDRREAEKPGGGSAEKRHSGGPSGGTWGSSRETVRSQRTRANRRAEDIRSAPATEKVSG